MSGWSAWLVGKRDNANAPKDAIVGLRQQLLMLQKKEEHLTKKIDDETRKAKANVTTNKRGKHRCPIVCKLSLSHALISYPHPFHSGTGGIAAEKGVRERAGSDLWNTDDA